jgi:hypothetical protein
VVQNVILVEETAQSDNYILAGDTSREDASESDLGDGRHLPPSLACAPDTGRIGSDNWRSLEESVFGILVA